MTVAGLLGRYRDGMSVSRGVVALVGNPASNNGGAARSWRHAVGLLRRAGEREDFIVRDLTGRDYAESMASVRRFLHEPQTGTNHRSDVALVVVGGDGMVSLGVNAVAGTDVPLGIIAVGSGNDFARGMSLPRNDVARSVRGIVRALRTGSTVAVDVAAVTGGEGPGGILRRYVGMLSCGLDAAINDRANRSRLPGGSLRYLAAVLVEVTRMRRYGYHLRMELGDGSREEGDLMSPLLTVADSRHIGGGIEVSPYSRTDDGLLEVLWLDHMPRLIEVLGALRHVYDGRLPETGLFRWRRVREVRITRSHGGDEPPVLMADGERLGWLPVTVDAEPAAFRLLLPPTAHGSGVPASPRFAEGRDGRAR